MSDNTFDINDPNLAIDLPDDYDPDAEFKSGKPMPPADGKHQVRVRLIETKDKPVYFKNGAVLAACKVQLVKPDGSNGAFLKDWYPSTRPKKSQKSTDLAYLTKVLGNPLPRTMVHPAEIIAHVEKAFNAKGEEGAVVTVETEWIKSMVIDGQFVDIAKGQRAVAESAVQAAVNAAYENGWDEETKEKAIAYATENPHLYLDSEGTERSVRAQVKWLVGA